MNDLNIPVPQVYIDKELELERGEWWRQGDTLTWFMPIGIDIDGIVVATPVFEVIAFSAEEAWASALAQLRARLVPEPVEEPAKEPRRWWQFWR